MGLANPDLAWQKKYDNNIGADLSFLQGAVNVRFDYYVSTTKGTITSVTTPPSMGFSSYMANLGEVQNQGFEIALNSTNIQNRNFIWNTSVGFSINKNKINHIYYDYDENGVEKDDTSNGSSVRQSVLYGIMKPMEFGRILLKTLLLLLW